MCQDDQGAIIIFMLNKVKGAILVILGGLLAILFIPNVAAALAVIVTALTGKLAALSPFQAGRLWGHVTISVALFGLFVWLIVYGIKLLKAPASSADSAKK